MQTRSASTTEGSETSVATAWRNPGAIVAELRRRNTILFAVGAVNAALFVAFAAGTVLDPSTVGGEPAWLKPAKFAGSIAIVCLTLTWLGVHLPVGDRVLRRVSGIVGGGFVIEIVLIGGQAARGLESHFNQSTVLDATVGAVMGVTILVVTSTIGWLAVRSWRGGVSGPPAFAAGVFTGLALFVVGAFEGGSMIALQATGVDPGGPTVPVVGWHLVGDFRLAHFVGLHALQALPLVGYLAARRGDALGIDRPVRAVRLLAAVYAGVLCLTLGLALVPLFG